MLSLQSQLNSAVTGISMLFLWTLPTYAQQLSGRDIADIVDTYRQNELRFKRDYVGRPFSAVLPFYKVSEGFFSSINGPMVQFANGKVYCFAKNKAERDDMINWNRGDRVRVDGIISDVVFGDISLNKCSFGK